MLAVKSPAAPAPPSSNTRCQACSAPTPVMGRHGERAPALPSGHGPVRERDRRGQGHRLAVYRR